MLAIVGGNIRWPWEAVDQGGRFGRTAAGSSEHLFECWTPRESWSLALDSVWRSCGSCPDAYRQVDLNVTICFVLAWLVEMVFAKKNSFCYIAATFYSDPCNAMFYRDICSSTATSTGALIVVSDEPGRHRIDVGKWPDQVSAPSCPLWKTNSWIIHYCL